MRKIFTALVAAASLSVAAIAVSTPANAQWHRGWHGGFWGPGAGFVAGAIIGGALAAPYYPYGYYPYAPAPYYAAPCVWRRVWNGYAWVRACV